MIKDDGVALWNLPLTGCIICSKMQQLFQCSRCGAQNYTGEQFCWSCANRFQYNCPYCRTAVNPAFTNCQNCGAPLAQQAQQPMPPPVYPQYPPAYPQQPPQNYYPQQSPGWGQPPPANPYQAQWQQGYYGYGGAAPKKKGGSSGIVLLAVITIVVVLVGALGVMTNGKFDSIPTNIFPKSSTPSASTPGTTPSSTPASPSTPAAPAAPVQPAVTAKELVDAFTADKSAAEAKYKGKTIKITGTLASFSASGTPYILLTSGSPNESGAKCMFAATDISKILSLEPAQSLTVEGKVSDFNVDVIVSDCIFK